MNKASIGNQDHNIAIIFLLLKSAYILVLWNLFMQTCLWDQQTTLLYFGKPWSIPNRPNEKSMATLYTQTRVISIATLWIFLRACVCVILVLLLRQGHLLSGSLHFSAFSSLGSFLICLHSVMWPKATVLSAFSDSSISSVLHSSGIWPLFPAIC